MENLICFIDEEKNDNGKYKGQLLLDLNGGLGAEILVYEYDNEDEWKFVNEKNRRLKPGAEEKIKKLLKDFIKREILSKPENLKEGKEMEENLYMHKDKNDKRLGIYDTQEEAEQHWKEGEYILDVDTQVLYKKENNKEDNKTIKENECDYIALTEYEGGEPVKFTKSDKELETWLDADEEHSWFPVTEDTDDEMEETEEEFEEELKDDTKVDDKFSLRYDFEFEPVEECESCEEEIKNKLELEDFFDRLEREETAVITKPEKEQVKEEKGKAKFEVIIQPETESEEFDNYEDAFNYFQEMVDYLKDKDYGEKKSVEILDKNDESVKYWGSEELEEKKCNETYKPSIWENKKLTRYSKEWYEWLLKNMDKYNVDEIDVKFSKNQIGGFSRDRVRNEIEFLNRMDNEEQEIKRLLNDFVGDKTEFELTDFNSASRDRGFGLGTKVGGFWLGKEPNTLILRSNEDRKSYLIASKEDIDKFLKGELTPIIKQESLKEELGAFAGEEFCEEIADRLEDGYWSGYTNNDTPWELTVNGMSRSEFSPSFADYLAEEISYPVRAGYLRYMDIQIHLYKSNLESYFGYDNIERKIPDLIKLDLDREDIDEWLRDPDPDALLDFYCDYDVEFDVDEWEEKNAEHNETEEDEDDEELEESKTPVKESLTEEDYKEIEEELADLLERKPEKGSFEIEDEEVKEYIKKRLQEKKYEVEVSGNDLNKSYHIEYYREKEIKEELEEKEDYKFKLGGVNYYVKLYPDNAGYIAKWWDDSDNGLGYNNKGFVNLDKTMSELKDNKEKDIREFISVISEYDRALPRYIRNKIIDKVVELKKLDR